eukprot:scaffold2797_cov69-Phaeocystis_antarctica.AAC.3
MAVLCDPVQRVYNEHYAIMHSRNARTLLYRMAYIPYVRPATLVGTARGTLARRMTGRTLSAVDSVTRPTRGLRFVRPSSRCPAIMTAHASPAISMRLGTMSMTRPMIGAKAIA